MTTSPPNKKLTVTRVKYCPLTFLAGEALANRPYAVIPYPKPVSGIVGVDIILTEVVREMGDREPQNYAIPINKLDQFIPNIGRATVKLITQLPPKAKRVKKLPKKTK